MLTNSSEIYYKDTISAVIIHCFCIDSNNAKTYVSSFLQTYPTL